MLAFRNHIPENIVDQSPFQDVELNSNSKTFSPITIDVESQQEVVQSYKKRQASETFSWGLLLGVIMAVSARTVRQYSFPKNSWKATAIDVAVVVLAPEYFKQMFNRTGGLKQEAKQTFNWKLTAVHFIGTAVIASILCANEVNKNAEPIMYDMPIIFSGIGLKFLLNFFEANYCTHAEEAADEHEGFVRLLEQTTTPVSPYAGKWYNKLAAYGGVEFFLLFFATNAGGQFLEAFGLPLATGLLAMGLTNLIATIIFSVYLNTVVGFLITKGSGKFEDKMPMTNLASRLLSVIILPAIFQTLDLTTGNELGDFGAGFAVAYSLLVLMEAVFPISENINKNVSYVLSAKCCTWQSKQVTDKKAIVDRHESCAIDRRTIAESCGM
ncbi:MAG: hypothetical protein V4496_00680 [Pseudomonadota bacterium]